MLVEPPIRVILLASNLGSQPGVPGGHDDAERKQERQPVSWWDKVAEKWPNGGRFPSLIVADHRV